MIFEMLAGYLPFYDENPFGIYQKVLAGRIDFRKHLDVKQWKNMSLEFKKEYAKWSVCVIHTYMLGPVDSHCGPMAMGPAMLA